ncbi:hypothetical protein [Paenibacillus hexagrammi]|uniref:Uncharacterized protein n=1 Tax=Paenibacillus hexagrammi TaxID=2908839 RepID=A0ABY3SH45_9BACL|nr:hypothetical protein [Paenibacillus sp. YPD9-1]UJF33337.1 hypothetical protein L0M14_28130 [Paenibacillus sp. YPD9-1]
MNVFKWLGKLVVSTVLITSISVITTSLIVNLYVQEIFRQFQIPALGKKIQISEIAARLGEELNIVKPRDEGKQTAEGPSQSPTASPDAAVAVAPSPSVTPAGPEPDSSKAAQGPADGVEEESVPVMGRIQNDSDLVISTEDFAKKKEQLTSEDKMEIFSLVVAKLPQNEVQHLSVLLEDGITSEELKEVDQTLSKSI